MKLVMTLVTRDSAEMLDAHLAFHLNAGVDFVIAADEGSVDGTLDILGSYARDGFLHVVDESADSGGSDARTRVARLAATEFGADWVIATAANEFWWPRAESLEDVLVAIPPRYTIVQALVRRFVPGPDDGRPSWERTTVRRTVQPDGHEALDAALRPVVRADPAVEIGPRGVSGATRRVPLRAWYPIEVFLYPVPGEPADDARALGDDELARGLADGSLAVDTRLRDALSALRTSSAEETATARAFALPVEGVSRLTLRPPDVVDDAAYAVECAELGEVDVTGIVQQVDELERRIAELEARFWPRVQRKLIRVSDRLRRRTR